jgi:hypothetical protein
VLHRFTTYVGVLTFRQINECNLVDVIAVHHSSKKHIRGIHSVLFFMKVWWTPLRCITLLRDSRSTFCETSLQLSSVGCGDEKNKKSMWRGFHFFAVLLYMQFSGYLTCVANLLTVAERFANSFSKYN